MSHDDDIVRDDRAYAMLALQLRGTDDALPDGEITDDALAALYDGRLSQADREALLRRLAHDTAGYGRWVGLVEARETAAAVLDAPLDPAQVRADAPSHAVAGWRERVQAWLGSWLLPAGAVAAAIIAFVAINPGLPGYERDLRGLQRSFAAQAASLLASAAPLPTRGTRDPLPGQPYTPANSALANGLLAGLAALGDGAQIAGVTIDPQRLRDTSTLPEADAEALFALGRLAALSYAMCQAPLPEAYLIEALAVLQPLERRLDANVYREVAVLEGVRAPPAPDARALCAASTQLIARFAD